MSLILSPQQSRYEVTLFIALNNAMNIVIDKNGFLVAMAASQCSPSLFTLVVDRSLSRLFTEARLALYWKNHPVIADSQGKACLGKPSNQPLWMAVGDMSAVPASKQKYAEFLPVDSSLSRRILFNPRFPKQIFHVGHNDTKKHNCPAKWVWINPVGTNISSKTNPEMLNHILIAIQQVDAKKNIIRVGSWAQFAEGFPDENPFNNEPQQSTDEPNATETIQTDDLCSSGGGDPRLLQSDYL